MTPQDKNTALLLIDFQKGFDEEAYWGGNRNNRTAEQQAASILQRWRALQLPIFHIIHSSRDSQSRLHASHAGYEMKEGLKPIGNEPLIVKEVNSAFIGTNLKEQLDTKGITHVVIVGLTTNHCISTTTRMAGNYGYKVWLISDATATFDRAGLNGETFDAETIHQTALASLHNEFAQVIDTATLLSMTRI